MNLSTKYFGQIECDEDSILFFPSGLFGFDEEQHFLLLPFAGSDGSLLCLQSTVTPALAFVVMNPFSLKPDYAPELQAQELKAMGVKRSQELCFYVLCVVKNPISDSTVNLKCPIAINDESNRAAQFILETDEYDMRCLLSEFGRKAADASC